MSTLKLVVGGWVVYAGQRHQILGFAGPGITLRSETGLSQVILTSELLADPSLRAAVNPPEDTLEQRPVLDHDAVIAGLPIAEREKLLLLESHLNEIETGHRDPMRTEPGEPKPEYAPGVSMSRRIAAKAQELELTQRWLWKLRSNWITFGLFGLVDKRQAKPHNPLARLDPRVITAIREQAFLNRDDAATTVSGAFRRRVQGRLDFDYPGEGLKLPPRETFRRAVQLLVVDPAGPTARKRAEDAVPDREFSVITAARPGEAVMIDTTPLDVRVYDPATNDTYGLELSLAIDVATRSLLAWRFTAEGTKAIDIGLVLADIMAPEPMRLGWAETLRFSMGQLPFERLMSIDERLHAAAARPVIYPETIIFDHGKQYQADNLIRFCRRLGINRQDARKMKATDKAQVERSFKTIRMQFSEHVAGYKGYDVAHRGKDPDAIARWTASEIEDYFAEYVIAIYQRRWHDGLLLPGFPKLRLSPNDAYALAIASAGYIACPVDLTLYYELMPIAQGGGRKIQNYGVDLHNLIYNGPVLRSLGGGNSPYHNGKWPIRYDPRNMLHAYVMDTRDGTWHQLTWTRAPSGITPFTDITLREAKRLLVQRGQNPKSQEAIADALTDLQNRTDAPESWQRKDRVRAARDAERARQATRDRSQAAPLSNTDYEPEPAHDERRLRIVADPDDSIDFSKIKPAAVWRPHQRQDG